MGDRSPSDIVMDDANEKTKKSRSSRIIGADSLVLQREQQSKHQAIKSLMVAMKLTPNQVLFVDDDLKNIASIDAEKLCDTIHVTGGEGLTEDHFSIVENWATSN